MTTQYGKIQNILNIMDNLYFIQIPLTRSMACLPQAVGTIWGYCEQFKEVTDRYQLAGVLWKDNIDIQNPKVVAASCYMWNWKETYDIIKKIKKEYPDCIIVVGGPDPKYTSEWCKDHPEIDAVIAYYGEETMRKILVSDTLDLPGVVTKDFNNALEAEYADPKDIPSPYLNGFFDTLLKGNKQKIRVVFEGNRGCPYSCSFCDIGHKKYQKIQMFDTERCLAELEWICNNNVRVIDVADSNFGIFPRDEQLVDYIVEQKDKGNFDGTFMPTWAKTHGEKIIKLAKKLQQSGVDEVFGFSLQSTNPKTLKNVKRKNTYDIKGFAPIIKDLSDANLSSYTELIFPMPGDTIDNFKSGLHEILDMPAPFQMLQVNSLSRLSNTEFNTGFKELTWANIKGTAKPYDNDVVDEICVATDTLTKGEVFEGLFYSRSFVIPMYWYGLATYMLDENYKMHSTRSKLIKNIYTKLFEISKFQKLKQEMKDHYFKSIEKYDHIGYRIINRELSDYYTDTAYSHLYYIKNNIFDVLVDIYPQYSDIINKNKKDIKSIDNLEDWLQDIHVRRRFTTAWKS